MVGNSNYRVNFGVFTGVSLTSVAVSFGMPPNHLHGRFGGMFKLYADVGHFQKREKLESA